MVRLFFSLLTVLAAVQAWMPPYSSSRIAVPSSHRSHCSSRMKFLVLQSTEESSSAEETTSRSTSYDDAGRKIMEEENEEIASSMVGDEDDAEFEQRAEEYDAIRAEIRARTKEMGIEKAVMTAKFIEERQAVQAEEAAASSTSTMQEKVQQATADDTSFGGLDLSQISTFQRPLDDESSSSGLPILAEDLEEQFQKLPEDERKAIDPTEGMNWVDSLKYELQFIEWPTPLAALKEVALVVVIVAFMAFVIINFDTFLRTTFTDLGMIPASDQVSQQFEGLALPDGWTDGLTSEDIVNVPIEGGSTGAAGSIPSDL